MRQNENSGIKCTFSGSVFFEHMRNRDLYLTNINEIENKVKRLNLIEIFKK
jgi:hypothetical protein